MATALRNRVFNTTLPGAKALEIEGFCVVRGKFSGKPIAVRLHDACNRAIELEMSPALLAELGKELSR